MSKICFFDVDGTLIDSYEGIRYSLEQALKAEGLTLPEESVLRSFIGPPIERSIAGHWDISADRVRRTAAEFQRVYREEGYARGVLYPHIPQVLEAAQSQWDLYVVTNKNVLYAKKTLDYFGIGHYFKGILCTDRVNQIDKNRLIGDQLRQYPAVDQAVMVGDTIGDYQATEGHPCGFIGVGYGFGLKDQHSYPFPIVPEPIDLIPLLTQ